MVLTNGIFPFMWTVRQTRKFITHTGCIFYSTLLICSAYKSAPVISHTHHISFIHLTRFQTFQLLPTFHSQTHFIFQIPFIQAHIVVLIRHKSRPRWTFPAHCRCRNTKTTVTDMSINNTDRSYWQYNVFPPLHTRMHLARHLVIFSNHTYKSTCYKAWPIRHLTTTLRT